MTIATTVDVAGGPMGGAARFRSEFYSYLQRTGREDIRVIGDRQRVNPSWLLRREVLTHSRRKLALNNVGFVSPGGQRWTLLGNALHFLTDEEAAALDRSLRVSAQRQAAIVRLAAKRSDVLVAPCTAMAERVKRVLPGLRSRVVVRMHPVSPDSIPKAPRDPIILCPVIWESYKNMSLQVTELIQVMERLGNSSLRLQLTAYKSELPDSIASHPQVGLMGHLPHAKLRDVWARSKAIYFPSGLESFGYPLAEARVSGHPVIARETEQNREIAGDNLFGFIPRDTDSLQRAAKLALTTEVKPDPAPFDPVSYFDWILGCAGE